MIREGRVSVREIEKPEIYILTLSRWHSFSKIIILWLLIITQCFDNFFMVLNLSQRFWKIQIVGKSKFKFSVKLKCVSSGKTISARVLKSFPATFVIWRFFLTFLLSKVHSGFMMTCAIHSGQYFHKIVWLMDF